MKNLFCFLLLIVSNLFSFSTFAQVGIGTQIPDASAMLDVQSTVKGILVPRMTSAQRLAIPSGAPNGLLVFDTDNNSFWFFKSPTWMQITAAVGFAATPTSGKTIADNSYSTLAPYTESFDDGNNFNPANGTFTAPSSGMYHFDGLVQWNIGISGSPQNHVPSSIRIYNNGTIVEVGQVTRILDIDAGFGDGLSVSVNVKLAIGDVVNIGVFYVSGTNTFVAVGGGGSGSCYFSGYKVY